MTSPFSLTEQRPPLLIIQLYFTMACAINASGGCIVGLISISIIYATTSVAVPTITSPLRSGPVDLTATMTSQVKIGSISGLGVTVLEVTDETAEETDVLLLEG